MKKNLAVVGLVFAVCVAIGYFILKDDRLPVYNPTDISLELVDPSIADKSQGHRVSDFNLTNQLGEEVTLANLEGKVYVTDFFFTTCGTICPKMTKQLERVHKKFADRTDVMIVSHSVTPDIDSVPRLKKYADKHGADPEKWIFLTGDQDQIFRLARKSYFAVVPGSSGAETGFVHTENFVLVDKERRLRGFYDGTSTEKVNRLMEDIQTLLEEYE